MPTKSLVKRTRKPRNPFQPKVEKELTHVTAEQVLQRHIYCVPLHILVGSRDVAETTSRLAAKGQLHAWCDHPQDGWCRVGNYPTNQELEEINHRLNPKGNPDTNLTQPVIKKTPKPQDVVRAKRVNSYFCMKCEDWHNEPHEIYTEHMEFKRKRGQRLLSQLKPKVPAKYFCTKCNDWHQEPDPKFKTHAKYKRKRGRQKGWNKT